MISTLLWVSLLLEEKEMLNCVLINRYNQNRIYTYNQNINVLYVILQKVYLCIFLPAFCGQLWVCVCDFVSCDMKCLGTGTNLVAYGNFCFDS
jgi:hypothetical protein